MAKNEIVILNGPPGCGKDSMAGWFRRIYEFEHLAFKEPIFDAVLQLTGIPSQEWFERYDDRDLKEEPWDRINDMSCRDLMIHVSENVMKKIHGQDYFGKVMAEKIKKDKDYVFSDGGFIPEIKALKEAAYLTHELYVIRIFRQDCEFKGDSRSYVNHNEIYGAKGFSVINYEDDCLGAVLKIKELMDRGYNEK